MLSSLEVKPRPRKPSAWKTLSGHTNFNTRAPDRAVEVDAARRRYRL